MSKQERGWFFTTVGDTAINGFFKRFVNGSKPNQATFQNFADSVPFFKEVTSAASVDTGQALENKQGLVIVASDANAKSGTNTADAASGGTVVVRPSQLPTASTENQTVGTFTGDTPISVGVDATTTRNNFVIKLKASFISFLETYFPSHSGATGKYLKSDGTTASWDAIDISTTDITGTLPIGNGGTGQTTASAARNALLPSKTGNTLKLLRVNAGETDYELVTPPDVSDYVGTSTSNVTIATGSKSFTASTGLSYTAGTRIRLASEASAANFMEGNVTSYNSGTGALVVSVDTIGGAGTLNDWNINIGGSPSLAGDTYKTTSSTSLAIAVGSKAFDIGTGYAYQVGVRARATSQASSANFMEGVVSSYSAGILTIDCTNIGGSGTLADWNINLGASVGANGWTTVTSFTSADIASGSIKYRREDNGWISFKGVITFDAAVSTREHILFTLPAGYRPLAGNDMIFTLTAVDSATLSATIADILPIYCNITSAGVITLITSATATDFNDYHVYMNEIYFPTT